jgi:hypothetical protein
VEVKKTLNRDLELRKIVISLFSERCDNGLRRNCSPSAGRRRLPFSATYVVRPSR